MGADTLAAADPRLVALGLATELVVEFPPGTVEIDLLEEDEPPRVDPVVVAPPVAESAKLETAPTPVAPTLPPSPVLLRAHAVMGPLDRDGQLVVEELGLRLLGARELALPWDAVTSIDAHRERVRLETSAATIELRLAVDGVGEPELSAPFAEVLRAISRGSFDPHGTAAVQLHNTTDALRERFNDVHDGLIGLLVTGAGLSIAVVGLFAIPDVLTILMRPSVPRDAFVLTGRIAPFDPRIVAAALGAGVLVAFGLARSVFGRQAASWARGVRRGWHEEPTFAIDRVQRAVAWSMQYPVIAAAVFTLGLLGAIPSARPQTTVDPRGIHALGPLPAWDRDVSWDQVTDVAKVPASGEGHPDGSAVAIRAGDVTVSTAAMRLVNGTDAYFLDMIARWRGR